MKQLLTLVLVLVGYTVFAFFPLSTFAFGPTVTVEQGEAINLHWDVIGASSCVGTTDYPGASDGIRTFWLGAHAGYDTQPFVKVTAPPSSPSGYTFTCAAGAISDQVTLIVTSCGGGRTWDPGSETCVVAPPSAPTGLSLTNNGPIPYNTSANLTMGVSGATNCRIDPILGTVNPNPDVWPTGNLTATTDFTLECWNGSSPHVTASTQVVVGPPPPGTHPVTVTPPTGGGSITGPGGINCPRVCSTTLPAGSTPTITVTPPPGGSVQSITVNGVNQGSGPSITLPPLSGPVTIEAVCNPPSAPDLESQSFTVPGSGTDGVSMSVSAVVRNVGGVAAGAFTDNFTYQWNGVGGWTQFATVPHGGGLGAGASVSDGPVSYTPTQSGTLRIQHCVDAVPASGAVAESSESNCSVSSAINVGSGSLSCPGSPTGGTASCSYTSGASGGSTVSGSCTGGNLGSCTVWCNPSTGNWEDSSTNCDPSALPITLEVCDVAGNNCTSTPGPLPVGSTPSIRWTSNGDWCGAQSGAGFSTGGAPDDFDPVPLPPPGTSDTYSVMCTNGGNIATAPIPNPSIVITAQNANPTLTVKLNGSPVNTVKIGAKVTIDWDANNGNEALCSLTGGGFNYSRPPGLPAGGNADPETGTTPLVTIQGRTTFVIDCSGLTGVKTIDVVPEGWES